MRWIDLLALSLQNLWRRKLRTILTIVGVMIGTCSIVVMMSIGLGANKAIMEQVQSMGDLTLITVNDYSRYEMGGGGSNRVKLDDKLLREWGNMEHVTIVTPVMRLPAQIELITGRYSSRDSLMGIRPEAFEALGIPVIEGRGLGSDSTTKNIEVTIGKNNKSYFTRKNSNVWGEEPDLDWLNERYTLDFLWYDTVGDESVENRKSYKVTLAGITGTEDYRYSSMHDYYNYVDIGVLKKLGRENPKSLYQEMSTSYEEAWVKVDDFRNVEAVMEVMREGNNLNIYSDMQYVSMMQEQAQSMQLLLGGIGSITMLVAAISIANTMLMSIYERTREIGVMKVLGCRLGNISMLFLGEAGFIGLFGGIVGVGLSYGLSALLNFVFAYYGGGGMGGMQSYIPPWLAVLALVFSIGVGMLSGLYPSQRAMRLSALAAIRNDV